MRTRDCVLVVLLFLAAAVAQGSDVPGLKFTAVDFPGARITDARGTNNLGQIVGAWEDAVTRRGHGFVLGGGVYTAIDVPGALHTTASGINDSGDVVGTYEIADATGATSVHGFLLTAGGQFTTITVPGKTVTQAFGINNLGQIVGTYVDLISGEVTAVHGFLLEDGRFTAIDFPIATANRPVTFALGIDDAGRIVGGYNDNDVYETRRGFVLTQGIFSRFDVPGALMTDIFGLDNVGGLVGMYQDARDGQFYSFLFTPKRGFSRVSAKGSRKRARALTAFDVNDHGQIVGSSYDGTTHGFLAHSAARR